MSNSGTPIGVLLQEGVETLRRTSSSARLDSEVLLAWSLGTSRGSVISSLRDPCPVEGQRRFHECIARRALGEPVAYITGEREFWGLPFVVSPAVLVPRPESELLVERALGLLKGLNSPKILDLGTGSGCLVIAVAKELSARGDTSFSCDAIDCSAAALRMARENARLHGVDSHITWGESDWFSNRKAFSPPYDLIVANPPYIDPSETIPRELSFEPRGALFADDRGLRDAKLIMEGARKMLKPEGTLLIEVGAGKRALLLSYLRDRGDSYRFLGDDSPEDRFTVVELQV